MSIALFRKFGLHASANALAARDAYREGKTCRTCVHLDSDPRDEPCGTCRRFERWQDARAEKSKAPNGVTASDETQQIDDAHVVLQAAEEFDQLAELMDSWGQNSGAESCRARSHQLRQVLHRLIPAIGVAPCDAMPDKIEAPSTDASETVSAIYRALSRGNNLQAQRLAAHYLDAKHERARNAGVPAAAPVSYTHEPAQDALLAKFAAAGFKYDGFGCWQADLTTTELLSLGGALGVGVTDHQTFCDKPPTT